MPPDSDCTICTLVIMLLACSSYGVASWEWNLRRVSVQSTKGRVFRVSTTNQRVEEHNPVRLKSDDALTNPNRRFVGKEETPRF